MIAKYINPLIQFNYWYYDLLFVNDNDEILTRVSTFFYSEPTQQDFYDRVNYYNETMELNYTINSIEI
jgi:hypothetical protein